MVQFGGAIPPPPKGGTGLTKGGRLQRGGRYDSFLFLAASRTDVSGGIHSPAAKASARQSARRLEHLEDNYRQKALEAFFKEREVHHQVAVDNLHDLNDLKHSFGPSGQKRLETLVGVQEFYESYLKAMKSSSEERFELRSTEFDKYLRELEAKRGDERSQMVWRCLGRMEPRRSLYLLTKNLWGNVVPPRGGATVGIRVHQSPPQPSTASTPALARDLEQIFMCRLKNHV